MNTSSQENSPRTVVEYHEYQQAIALYVEDFGVQALRDLVEDIRRVLAEVDAIEAQIKSDMWKETKTTTVFRLATSIGTRTLVSFDVPVNEGEKTVSLAERIKCEAESPYEAARRKEFGLFIKSIFEKGGLSERQQRVLSLRYGIEDHEEHTLESVGALFGITRERVRQIEMKALRKAKQFLASSRVYAEHVL